MIRSYRSRWPQIAPSAYIDPAATVIGDVAIGEQASAWPGVVIRGDVHWIRIGGDTGKPIASLGEQAPGAASVYAIARALEARVVEVTAAGASGPRVEIV